MIDPKIMQICCPCVAPEILLTVLTLDEVVLEAAAAEVANTEVVEVEDPLDELLED